MLLLYCLTAAGLGTTLSARTVSTLLFPLVLAPDAGAAGVGAGVGGGGLCLGEETEVRARLA